MNKSLLTIAALALVSSANAALVDRYLFNGNGNDSVGTNGLTTTGNVTYVSTGLPSGLTSAAQVADNSINNVAATSYFSKTGMSASNISLQNFTVSFWFNQQLDMITGATNKGFNDIISLNSTNTAAVEIMTTGTDVQPKLSVNNEASNVALPSAVALNSWNNVVIVGTGSGISYYFNGTLVGTGAAATDPLLTELYLFRGGYYNSGSVRGWDGQLADLQIYNTALSGSDAAFLAANPGLTAVPEPGTYGLVGAGALAAAALVRRRRKSV